MATIIDNNIPKITINKLVNTLANSYLKLIEIDKPLNYFPSVMLWGQPGVGKSQAIRQIAKKIEDKSNKKVNITDVRLLLFNPIDLRGIPVANKEKDLAIWLKPKIFQMDPSDDVINILFLDEVTAAPQSLQAAAYQITLDRQVGEHKLPENCIVIAAGNRVTDKSVAYKMPKALSNRLLHFEIKSDFISWKKWALKNNINQQVINFLEFKEECLNTFNRDDEAVAFATPRSWEMVSNIMNFMDDALTDNFSLIAGLIGNGLAYEFKNWCKSASNLPKIADIMNGLFFEIPKEPSLLYTFLPVITGAILDNLDNTTGVTNLIKYVLKFPKDFSVVILKDLLTTGEPYVGKLMRINEFRRWAMADGALLNGFTNSR